MIDSFICGGQKFTGAKNNCFVVENQRLRESKVIDFLILGDSKISGGRNICFLKPWRLEGVGSLK